MENKKKIFFPNLNGLRFLGALMVFIFHVFALGKEIWGNFAQTDGFKLLLKITEKGHHGVGLFFTLSGFLLTYLLLDEVNNNAQINVKNFLYRRILRIWPLYFLVVFFGFLVFPYLPYGQFTEHSLLNYSLLLSNLDEIWNGANDPLNFLTITWSVSIEEQFYLFWIALLALFPLMRKGRYFPVYFFTLIIVSVIFRYLYYSDERMMYYHTLSNITDLAIGGLTAYGVVNLRWDEKIRRLSRLSIIVFYLLGITTLVAATKLFPGELRSIERLIQGSFFAFVIMEQVYSARSLFKMDRIPGFAKAGKLTYGFYMFHCIYIYYWGIFFQSNGFTEHWWQFLLYFLIIFTCTYLTSILSFKYFEGPILKMRNRFRGN